MLKKIHLSKSFIVFASLVVVTGAGFVLAPICTNMDLPTLLFSLGTHTISIDELKKGNLKDVILIDVRTPEEYEEDHIDHSVSVPIDDIKQGLGIQRISSIVKSNPKFQINPPTLIVYCTVGRRSIKAYKALKARGIHTLVLAGGITAWRKSVTPEQDASFFLTR